MEAKETDAPIMLFDGVCNLCSGIVQFILKQERDTSIQFASLQSEKGTSLLSRYNIDPHVTDSIVYIQNGKAYVKSAAAFKIATHLKMPWRIVGWFRFIPAWLSDTIYDLIARNRYRLFGKKDECWLPHPKWKERFIQSAA